MLTATIEAPESVKLGEVFRYRVTLTNVSSAPLLFGTCPAFGQYLSGTKVERQTAAEHCDDRGAEDAGEWQ